jgi:hypothetical protein
MLQGERRPGFVGLPLPGVEAKIDCAAGMQPPVGELLVRGANLFQEYWGRAEAIAECFTQDGFFRTGGWRRQGWWGSAGSRTAHGCMHGHRSACITVGLACVVQLYMMCLCRGSASQRAASSCWHY